MAVNPDADAKLPDRVAPCRVSSAISSGMLPPFVSHSTTSLAPALAAARIVFAA